MRPRIGVLTSGGDCPGLNAVLRGVVLAADKLGWEVVGFRDGFEGLLPPGDHLILDRRNTNGIMPLGGTIIGTTNRGHFVAKVGAGNRTIVPKNIIAGAKKILDELNVGALIIVGGDGSMITAQQLQEAGINCIGVPKTIDNDLGGTDVTFGFQTAVQIVTDAIDRLHTTAESHNRVMVVEVMGRHAGWIATAAGIAGGADAILVPERPFDIEQVVAHLRRRHAAGLSFSIVVVAEGAMPLDGDLQANAAAETDAFGHPRLGGIGVTLEREIERRTGFESRVTILGHVQRGGTPVAFDRVLATRFGVGALDAVADGRFGTMVALRGTDIVEVDLDDALREPKLLDPRLYETAELFFG